MHLFRNPLLPVGVLLAILGFGNWYVGHHKGREYELFLAAGHLPANIADFAEFGELNERTNATLLNPIRRGSDESTLVNAKLDFYKLVQSGGRILMLGGLFFGAAGLIHAWYRQRHEELESVKVGE